MKKEELVAENDVKVPTEAHIDGDKSEVHVIFDTSHLSPQIPEHIRFVMEEYLKQKGVEYDEIEVIINVGTNAK